MRTNGDGRPVVALDIDGTLGDYHGHFLRFAEAWFGRPMPDATAINPGQRLSVFMGVPHARYRECKLAYRQGGLKRSMPVYPGARELTRGLRRFGAEVWICTTRPYLRLDNIDPDTREWLGRNGIQYDAVIFGERKYHELRRQARHRVAAIADDLPELVVTARRQFPTLPSAGLLIRDQPYNKHINPFEYQAIRVHSCAEIDSCARAAVKKWRAIYG